LGKCQDGKLTGYIPVELKMCMMGVCSDNVNGNEPAPDKVQWCVCMHACVCCLLVYVFMAHLMMPSVAQTTQQGTIAWLMNVKEMIKTDTVMA